MQYDFVIFLATFANLALGDAVFLTAIWEWPAAEEVCSIKYALCTEPLSAGSSERFMVCRGQGGVGFMVCRGQRGVGFMAALMLFIEQSYPME